MFTLVIFFRLPLCDNTKDPSLFLAPTKPILPMMMVVERYSITTMSTPIISTISYLRTTNVANVRRAEVKNGKARNSKQNVVHIIITSNKTLAANSISVKTRVLQITIFPLHDRSVERPFRNYKHQ